VAFLRIVEGGALNRPSVIGCAGARCVEKLFELSLLGGREVGQYLLVGDVRPLRRVSAAALPLVVS
jgi:hypothetical protein